MSVRAKFERYPIGRLISSHFCGAIVALECTFLFFDSAVLAQSHGQRGQTGKTAQLHGFHRCAGDDDNRGVLLQPS